MPSLPPDRVRAIIDSGDVDQYPTLDGTPGFCLAPMSWATAVAAVADGSTEALGTMGRDPAGVRVYWKWKEEVRRRWRVRSWLCFSYRKRLVMLTLPLMPEVIVPGKLNSSVGNRCATNDSRMRPVFTAQQFCP